jgi:hypothetical protein
MMVMLREYGARRDAECADERGRQEQDQAFRH